MSEPAETKVCPYCAETIKAAAKRCSRCQTKLGISPYWFTEGLICLFLGGLMALLLFLLQRASEHGPTQIEREFASHRNDLSAVPTSWRHVGTNTEFYLDGYITNKASRPWRIHELEIRILDSKGSLVDAHCVDIKDPFVIQPSQTHAFHVEVGYLESTNIPAASAVRVQLASDGNTVFYPD